MHGRALPGGHDLLPLSSVALLSFVIGIGLLLHRKWGAALFVVIVTSSGLWLGIGSIVHVPMPGMIINVVIACGFLASGAIVVRHWLKLKRK